MPLLLVSWCVCIALIGLDWYDSVYTLHIFCGGGYRKLHKCNGPPQANKVPIGAGLEFGVGLGSAIRKASFVFYFYFPI